MKVEYRVKYEATVEVEVPDGATRAEIEALCEATNLDRDSAVWVSSEIITEEGDEVASW